MTSIVGDKKNDTDEQKVKLFKKFLQAIFTGFLLLLLLFFFFQLLYLESDFLSLAFYPYLTVSNLVRLGISVCYQISVRLQYLVRFLSLCQITGGHRIYPPTERLSPTTGTESGNGLIMLATIQLNVSIKFQVQKRD